MFYDIEHDIQRATFQFTITQLLTNMFAFWRRPCGVSIDHQAALSLLFQLLVAGLAPGTRNLRPAFHQRFQAVACRFPKVEQGEVSAWCWQFRQEGTWVTWMFTLGRIWENDTYDTEPWFKPMALPYTFTYFHLFSPWINLSNMRPWRPSWASATMCHIQGPCLVSNPPPIVSQTGCGALGPAERSCWAWVTCPDEGWISHIHALIYAHTYVCI